ncbi:MAG TPA: hypothetical protein VMV98_03515, partial [Acidobacteriaceae bacterium]|nr:hypothetical protein [Acidobacteriaceae bacterium]
MKPQIPSPLKLSTFILITFAINGCATYKPRPLPTAPDLTNTVDLTIPSTQLDVPGLEPHTISPEGLDLTALMTLAVLNNPDLKAARLQANVARAQLLEAG